MTSTSTIDTILVPTVVAAIASAATSVLLADPWYSW